MQYDMLKKAKDLLDILNLNIYYFLYTLGYKRFADGNNYYRTPIF